MEMKAISTDGECLSEVGGAGEFYNKIQRDKVVQVGDKQGGTGAKRCHFQ